MAMFGACWVQTNQTSINRLWSTEQALERRDITGTVYWASLNSYNSIGQCISCLLASFRFIQTRRPWSARRHRVVSHHCPIPSPWSPTMETSSTSGGSDPFTRDNRRMGQSSGGARQLEGCLKDVTLPTRLEAEFDSIIPLILEVQTIRRRPQRQGEGN